MSAQRSPATSEQPEILARGPWALERVRTRWLPQHFEPSAAHTRAADEAIRGLQSRGSPSHDGMAARLVGYREEGEGIQIELQPLGWGLRLGTGGDQALATRGCRPAAPHGHLAGGVNGRPRAAALSGAGPLTFSRLKRASFTHSSIYVALLISAFAAGKPEPLTFALGLAHGV